MKLIPKYQNAPGPLVPSWQAQWVTEAKEREKREDQEYQQFISSPYYKIHQKPTKQQWRQIKQKLQNRGTIKEAEKVSAPVRAINNYVREYKYDMSQGNVPKGKHSLPLLGLAATGIGSFLSAPITTTAAMAGGWAGGKTLDSGMKLATGKSWAENMYDWTGLDKEPAEVTNPGMWVGGGVGIKGLNLAKQRVLDSAYNNFTPLGYKDTDGLPFFNHRQEVKDMLKEFFTPKRIDTSTSKYPKWYERAMEYVKSNPDAKVGPMSLKNVVQYRDEAWRLATNQKPRLGLYKANGDGTYSYNMELIDKMEGGPKLRDIFIKPTSESEGVANDMFTTNGGFVGIKLGPHNVSQIGLYRGTQYAGKPSFSMTDRWDLQPFKDSNRSFIPWITKMGTRYPKIFGHLKNIEVLEPLGGNPFTLRQTFPEGTANIHLYPQLKLPK